MFGALLHWWDGVPEDQSILPVMDLAEWDTFLLEVGFSRCDKSTAVSLDEEYGDNLVLFAT